MDCIISTVAWRCEDGHWHQANYWSYSDGTCGVDTFAGGDHNTIAEHALPTAEEEAASWRDYAADCAKTGADPLNNFIVARTHKRRVRYQVQFAPSIAGVVLQRWRKRSRGEWQCANIPESLRLYFCVSEKARTRYFLDPADVPDLSALRELAKSNPDVTIERCPRGGWFSVRVSVEESFPRSVAAISRDIRRIASARRGKRAES